MSTNATTIRMLPAYISLAKAKRFFSSMFVTTPADIHESEEIEVDVSRDDREISIVRSDLSTGYNYNEDSVYTNKKFIPPIHKEAFALDASKLYKRVAGQNPFASPDIRANVIAAILRGVAKSENKIRRAIELQSSQVMQLGIVTLIDTAANTKYTIDYKPKASHLPQSTVSWGDANDTVEADLISLAGVIRTDSLKNAGIVAFGETAFQYFMSDTAMQAKLNNRRMDIGAVQMAVEAENGATYHGTVQIGQYPTEIWAYDGSYKHPNTGVDTQYLDKNKVVMRAKTGILRGTFGGIPNIGQLLGVQNAINLPELPSRLSNVEGGLDLTIRVWMSPDGEQLFYGVGTRPLMIPVDIDSFGCLNTVAP